MATLPRCTPFRLAGLVLVVVMISFAVLTFVIVLLVALASPPVMPLALVAIVLRVVWQTVSFAANTALR